MAESAISRRYVSGKGVSFDFPIVYTNSKANTKTKNMQWILIALFSYFFGAVTVILDKYLLGSKRISSAPVYAFYVGIFGMGVLVLAPLGLFFQSFALHLPSAGMQLVSISGGVIYIFGIAAFYFAVRASEASRITPVVFSIIPIVTYIVSAITGRENLTFLKTGGIALLIFGGLLISLNSLPKGKKKLFSGFRFAVLSGLLLGFSYVFFKEAYVRQEFYSGFVWTRCGLFLGALLFLLIPSWRRVILASFQSAKRSPRKQYATGSLFVFNKILGGTSSLLLNKAFQLGSITAVNAMIAVQYVFVLAIAFMAPKQQRKIFGEQYQQSVWLQKMGAIIIIAAGMYLIS